MKHRILVNVGTLAVIGAVLLQPACGRSSPESSQTSEPAAASAPPATSPEAPASQTPSQTTTAPAASAAGRPAKPNAAVTPAPSTNAGGQTAAPVADAPKPEPPPPPPPLRKITLPAGTTIGVYTTSTLSTAANQSGEAFTGTLAKIIGDDGWVAAKQGSRVVGVIVNSDPGGKVKGVASMTMALQKLTMADGRVVELSTDALTQAAKQTKGKDAKKVGIGAGIGTAIGAIAGGGSGAAIGAAVGGGAGTAAALSTRGDAATVPAESLLTFTLTQPLTMIEQR